jgi:putative transposase
MTVIRLFKYRMIPNRKNEQKLNHHEEMCCDLHNLALEQRKMYQNHIKANDQEKQLVFLKKEFPEYQSVNAKVLQNVIERLDQSFQNFFRRLKLYRQQKLADKPGYPRFKKRYGSFQFSKDFRLNGKYLKLYKIGTVKLHLSRPIPEGAKIKNCAVKKLRGHWYAFLCVEYEEQPLPTSGLKVGIDVGINKFAAFSDGVFIENPRFFETSQKKLRRAQRRATLHKIRGSNRQKKSYKLVSKIGQHIANQRKDFQHKKSREVINKYGVIAVEDLNINGMIRSNLVKQIQDVGWATFIFFLLYKAESAGRVFGKVDAMYTSQCCFKCKHTCEENRKGEVFLCVSCGHRDHADLNAAKNILHKFQQQLGWTSLSSANIVGLDTCSLKT